MLIYPQIDYTTGFRPASPGDISVAQPDYSGVVDAERVYLRVFDAAYSNDGVTEPAVVGQPFLTFRIDGLELADIAYDVSPGPGNAYLALEIKIPGLTTWMDMGRPDMAGPSKQDPFNDGAGCQIIDPTATFDGVDAVTGTVFCQVRVNVGPAANIFANIGAVGTGVAPVLFRARIKSAGAAYNFTQGGSGATSDTPRALTGVTLLRHSDGSAPTSYGPPTFP